MAMEAAAAKAITPHRSSITCVCDETGSNCVHFECEILVELPSNLPPGQVASLANSHLTARLARVDRLESIPLSH